MGRDKAFLQLGGKSLIRWVLKVHQELFDQVIIVADSKERFRGVPCPVVCDLLPNRGPLGGIYTGLEYAKSERIFVTACDLPFLKPVLIRHLISLMQGYEAVIPYCEGHWHPLHAVYSKRCRLIFEYWMKGREYSIKNLIPNLLVQKVEESELRVYDSDLASMTNLNTPRDFLKAVSHKRRMLPCTP